MLTSLGQPDLTATDATGLVTVIVVTALGFGGLYLLQVMWRREDNRTRAKWLTQNEALFKQAHNQLTSASTDLIPYRSLEHLFEQRDRLLPRAAGRVDIILDPASAPQGLADWLGSIDQSAEIRLLLLDPNSSLFAGHHLAGDDLESLRARVHKVIEPLRDLAHVRLYDALPMGNLVIVDDRIFWGATPSAETDAPLPMLELRADTRGDLYWQFTRNYEALWKRAREPAARSSAGGSA